ncbi:MAG: hypothetical protein Q9172_002225 [Xanthocarpia lactea]
MTMDTLSGPRRSHKIFDSKSRIAIDKAKEDWWQGFNLLRFADRHKPLARNASQRLAITPRFFTPEDVGLDPETPLPNPNTLAHKNQDSQRDLIRFMGRYFRWWRKKREYLAGEKDPPRGTWFNMDVPLDQASPASNLHAFSRSYDAPPTRAGPRGQAWKYPGPTCPAKFLLSKVEPFRGYTPALIHNIHSEDWLRTLKLMKNYRRLENPKVPGKALVLTPLFRLNSPQLSLVVFAQLPGYAPSFALSACRWCSFFAIAHRRLSQSSQLPTSGCIRYLFLSG